MSSEKNTQETNTDPAEVMGMKPNTYCMLLHLSQLTSFISGGLGIIAPIVMWVIAKDKSPLVDAHGKNVMNWLISALIYGLISLVLIIVGIGILLLIALVILDIVFAIIGALKANEGVVWKYPLSIPFFK